LASDIDYIAARFDAMSKADKILASGFTVTIDEAKALAEAYPGILESYETTSDGLIKIDEKIAESAKQTAKT